MGQLSAQQVVARLKRLPALPSVVAQLLLSFDNDNVDVARIAAQIARDQGLAARVLRVANSPFYGLQTHIGTINEAVVVLGFRAIRGMVLVTGLNGAFQGDSCPGFDPAEYVRHNVGVGLVARVLAGECGFNGDLAFTSGILHDIGKLVLASCFAEQYSPVLLAHAENGSLPIDVERRELGLDHAEVGALLADTWHFPPILRAAVRDHHTLGTERGATIADLINVADALARGYGRPADSGIVFHGEAPHSLGRLAIDEVILGRVLRRVDNEMDLACVAFSS